MKKQVLLFLFMLADTLCFAQDITQKGMPFIQNYLPENYGNHGKVWQISASKNGLVYMASDNGLLEFDGETWSRFRDYRGYSRSLLVANDSTVYVGADMDFGVWRKNRFGKFDFTSFYPHKKNIQGFNEEFWGTYLFGSEMVFVSHQSLYFGKKGHFSKIPAPFRFARSFQVNARLFLADEKDGLFEFDGKALKSVFPFPNGVSFKIIGIYIRQNDMYLITSDKGILKLSDGNLSSFQTEVSPEISKNKVFSFINIENRYLAFGTILNGLYITDLDGKIIQNVNKTNGLPNNTVLSMFYQQNGKLWLGLDYGISCINILDKITYFHYNDTDFGTGYASALKDGIFYLGTNQGLFYAQWNELNNTKEGNPFHLINGLEGQVWALQNIDGKILCGHDKGLFELEGNSYKKIDGDPGFLSLIKFRENYLLAGNYTGISIFENVNGDWKFLKKMPLIVGAINQIVPENDKFLWVNIPNFGLIHFSLDQNLNPIHREIIDDKTFKGYFPFIFKDQKGIHIITNSTQYHYNPGSKKFEEEPYYEKNSRVRNLFAGFYRPINISEDYGFYSVNNGFALENFNEIKNTKKTLPKVLFRKATSYNNDTSTVFFDNEKIPYQQNNISISYLIPNEDNLEYQYFLKGFSKKWSSWSPKNHVEFLGLKDGDYVLEVRARKEGQVSPIQEFKFKIKAPWYRTFWSYLFYIMAFAGLIYLLKRYQESKLRKQKVELLKKEQNSLREQAEKHRQEMLIEKQRQLEIEKNHLKDEIKNKTIELATKAKDDEDKNRILHAIGEKIKEIEGNPNISKIRLGEIRRMLKTYLEIEDHTFEIQMDELHQEFFKSMKQQFPNLSIYDLRLCAYLKIGLNSKEMSEILQVLPSSINVSRSRLRKKLGLLPEDDLYEFLTKFG